MNRYELHITVAQRHLPALRSFGVAGKVLDIVLDSGENKDQLMIGIDIEAPNFISAFQCIDQQYKQISKEFEVKRLKVEAHPDNESFVYREFLQDPAPLYYEAHWKVRLGTKMRTECFRMPVFHSFNRDKPNIEYWTIRTDASTKINTFHATYKTITEYLERVGSLIKPPHKELALVDTNLKLDEGWIAKHG